MWQIKDDLCVPKTFPTILQKCICLTWILLTNESAPVQVICVQCVSPWCEIITIKLLPMWREKSWCLEFGHTFGCLHVHLKMFLCGNRQFWETFICAHGKEELDLKSTACFPAGVISFLNGRLPDTREDTDVPLHCMSFLPEKRKQAWPCPVGVPCYSVSGLFVASTIANVRNVFEAIALRQKTKLPLEHKPQNMKQNFFFVLFCHSHSPRQFAPEVLSNWIALLRYLKAAPQWLTFGFPWERTWHFMKQNDAVLRKFLFRTVSCAQERKKRAKRRIASVACFARLSWSACGWWMSRAKKCFVTLLLSLHVFFQLSFRPRRKAEQPGMEWCLCCSCVTVVALHWPHCQLGPLTAADSAPLPQLENCVVVFLISALVSSNVVFCDFTHGPWSDNWHFVVVSQNAHFVHGRQCFNSTSWVMDHDVSCTQQRAFLQFCNCLVTRPKNIAHNFKFFMMNL